MSALKTLGVEPFILDIDNISVYIQDFLQSDLLIVNIPSKNINSFCRLINEIEKSSIRKVVFVSSTSVYINNNKTILESDNTDLIQGPLHSIEEMFRNSKKFKTTIVRFGGLIGYNRNPGIFFRNGKIVTNPDSRVNLIHRDDCIGIIIKIIESGAWEEVFNCCADTHPTKREFYTQAAHAIGESTPKFVFSKEVSSKIISNQKVKSLLKYNFVYPDLMKIKFT